MSGGAGVESGGRGGGEPREAGEPQRLRLPPSCSSGPVGGAPLPGRARSVRGRAGPGSAEPGAPRRARGPDSPLPTAAASPPWRGGGGRYVSVTTHKSPGVLLGSWVEDCFRNRQVAFWNLSVLPLWLMLSFGEVCHEIRPLPPPSASSRGREKLGLFFWGGGWGENTAFNNRPSTLIFCECLGTKSAKVPVTGFVLSLRSFCS